MTCTSVVNTRTSTIPQVVPVLSHNVASVFVSYLSLSAPVCLSEDQLVGDESTAEADGRERSVLGSNRKRFFDPRTFGIGEDGESIHWALVHQIID